MKTSLDCGLALIRADIGDLPYIAECIRGTLIPSVTPEEAELSDLWADTTVAAALDSLSNRRMGDDVYVLTDGEDRKGMLWMGVSRDQYTAEPVGYLLGIFVSPELRGRGIGKELIGCAESWCADRGLVTMQISVGERNGAASRLYASAGYGPRSMVLTKTLKR